MAHEFKKHDPINFDARDGTIYNVATGKTIIGASHEPDSRIDEQRNLQNIESIVKRADMHDEMVSTLCKCVLVLSGGEMTKMSLINALENARSSLQKAAQL